FTRSGRMEFDLDLQRIALANPGTFRHQIKGVELEIDGFLPPTGAHGRLTNSGLGRYRDAAGQVKLRIQPAETLVLSRYNRRQDFPDAYYQLRESGVARFELAASHFPLNQRQPVLRSLALSISPEPGATLDGAHFAVTYPGQDAAVDVTVTAQNTVPKAKLPVAANASALGTYELTLAAADRA